MMCYNYDMVKNMVIRIANMLFIEETFHNFTKEYADFGTLPPLNNSLMRLCGYTDLWTND